MLKHLVNEFAYILRYFCRSERLYSFSRDCLSPILLHYNKIMFAGVYLGIAYFLE